MLNWVCLLSDDDLSQYRYRLSDPAKDVPLVTIKTSNKVFTPIAHYYEMKLFGES